MKTSVTITRKPAVMGIPVTAMGDGDIGEIVYQEGTGCGINLISEIIFNVKNTLLINSTSRGTFIWNEHTVPISRLLRNMRVVLLEPGDAVTITRTE